MHPADALPPRRSWLRRGLLAAGLLLGSAVLLLAWLWPDEQQLIRRVETEAAQRLGVPVRIGRLQWHLRPLPEVVLEEIATAQADPITIARLRVQPELRSLPGGDYRFALVQVEGAVVPQLSLRDFRGRDRSRPDEDAGDGQAAVGVPLERFVFRDLVWVERHGRRLTYQGRIDFDPSWRPRTAELERPGVQPAARLELQREGGADQWQIRIAIGGGSADGRAALAPGADGVLRLSGNLQPRAIEIQTALAALQRRSPLSGRASGRTVLQAQGRTAGELARSLATDTAFTVEQAVVLRFDLDKVVRSRGKDRAGQTPLDSLSGRMQTQNTEDGTRYRFTGVQARAGAYSAGAEATLYRRQVQAEGRLELPGGVLDLPFTVSGPVQSPRLSVPDGFFAGAAVGTVLLPGIGTVLGAKVGAALGKVLGDDPPAAGSAPQRPAPVTRPPARVTRPAP